MSKEWVSYSRSSFLNRVRFVHFDLIKWKLIQVKICFQLRAELEKEIDDMIVSYREDPDLQSVIDWIQKDWVSIVLSLPASKVEINR